MNTVKRKYLLYVATDKEELSADIFGQNRKYDVAIHDYSGDIYSGHSNAEYKFSGRGHKWPRIKDNLPKIKGRYSYFAFIDSDIEMNTDQINKLFSICENNNLMLHQPSLNYKSFGSHLWLYKKFLCDDDVRVVPFVEVMMPFFHSDALDQCAHTFCESESGWGLDLLWAKILKGQVSVSDSISVTHLKPVTSYHWTMDNGKTALEEFNEILERHKLSFPSIKKIDTKERLLLSITHWMSLLYTRCRQLVNPN